MSDNGTVQTTDAPLDFSAFEAAENAKVLGQDVAPETADEPQAAASDTGTADSAAEPATTAAAVLQPSPEKPVSKRQQHINELARNKAEADQRAADADKRREESERKAAEALERAQRLEARIAEIERAAKQPEPAKQEPPAPRERFPKFEAWLAANEGKDFDDFLEARDEWRTETARAEAAAAAARDAEDAKMSDWIQRRNTFRATDPTFDTVVMPFLARVQPGTPLGDTLMDSPVGPQLAAYLATHMEETVRIARLHPIQQLRALGKLEAQFESSSATTSTSASAGPAGKTVTTAPAPPTHLAARTADHGDRARAALERGDFAAFEAEENRKALAASR